MGSGYRTFVSGETLSAANLMGYLMDQAVMVFASTTARDIAVASPTEGMVCYTTDTNRFWFYNGSAWANWGNVNPDGSIAAPGVTFAGETNTGFYRVGFAQIGVSIFGAERFRFTGSAFWTYDGSEANPGYSFLNDTNTGFWLKASDQIGVSVGGSEIATFTSAGIFNRSVEYIYSAADNKIIMRDDDASGFTSYIRWENNTGVLSARMGPAAGDFYLYNGIGDIYLQTLGATNLTLAAGGNVVAGNFFSIPNHESGSYSEQGNCNINPTGGRIRRWTSTIRNKYAVEDKALEESLPVLSLRPVTFLAKRTDRPDFRWTGLIAEEAASTGIEDYANYDADGPAGINIPPIVSDLINVVRHLWEKVYGEEIDLVDIEPRRLVHLTLDDCPGT